MVTSFPFGNGLIEQAFTVFRGSSESLITFVPLIFLARLVIIQVTIGGRADYASLIKELFFLYIGFFVFQEVMEIVMKAPQVADHLLKNPDPIMMQKKDRGWIELVTDLFAIDLVNMISSVIYWIVCFCYLILMSFLIAIGAYIILFSTMLRMRWMFKAYISLVMILSIWPFVWYTVDQAFIFVIKSLADTQNNSGVIIAKVMGGVMKLSVPVVAAFAAMKVPVAAALGGVAKAATAGRGAKQVGLAGLRIAKGMGKGVGIHHAAESVRRNPAKQLENLTEGRKAKRFSRVDAAPMVAYGMHRARFGLKSSHGVKMGTNEKGSKVTNYPDLEKKHTSYRSYKNDLKDRYETRKEILRFAKKHSHHKSSHISSEKGSFQNSAMNYYYSKAGSGQVQSPKTDMRPEVTPKSPNRPVHRETNRKISKRFEDPSSQNNNNQPFKRAEPISRFEKGDFQ